MTPEQLAANFLIFSLYCAALWILWFWFIKDYLVDSLRQKLFDLRDGLFDEAGEGLLPYSHEAYTLMRDLLNGLIRFSHRLTIFEFISIIIIDKFFKATSEETEFEHKWEKAKKGLSTNACERLEYYREQACKEVFRHIIISSPVLAVVLVLFTVAAIPLVFVLASIKSRILQNPKKLMREAIKTQVDVIEETAVCIGKPKFTYA